MIFAMLNVSIVRFYLELRMIEIDVEIQISLFGLRQNSQITQIGYEVQLKETLLTLIKMDLFPTRVQISASKLCKTNHDFFSKKDFNARRSPQKSVNDPKPNNYVASKEQRVRQ